jgi:ribosomal protein S18 acetylase RimI-like enzyme
VNQKLPEGVTWRPIAFDDAEAAVEMFNARSMAFHGENQSTVEDMRGWWQSPRFDLGLDTQGVFDAEGRMIGWSLSADPGEPYVALRCGVVVHPEVAGCGELWDRLYAWAVARARERLPLSAPDLRVTLSDNAMEVDPARQNALERAGFSKVRVNNAMEIDLQAEIPDPVWPAGIVVRPIDVRRDLEAVVRADREAFRDHWGHVEEPFEQALENWHSWIASRGEDFDPSLWFLACAGDEVVGVGLFSSKIADDTTLSYVDSLGVHPVYRRRGLGLALLRHGFAEVQRRGYKAVRLDMDSENLTGALRLYERAGMRVIRRSFTYELELRPGKDLVTRELEG